MDKKVDENYLTIDLMIIFKKIWNRKLKIMGFSFGIMLIVLVYNLFLVSPKYSSTTKIVVPYQIEKKSFSQINVEEINSSDVLKKVIEDKQLEMSVSELSSILSVNLANDTKAISITVRGKNPKSIAEISNAIREVSVEKLKKSLNVKQISVLEEAKEPTKPYSPKTVKNVFIFGVGYVMLYFIYIFAAELLNYKVKNPKDVEHMFGCNLIGIVPKNNNKG